MTLIRIRKSDIDPSKPLPWSVFDARKRLLARRGATPESVEDFTRLVDNGMFRDTASEQPSGAERPVEEAATEPAVEEIPLDAVRLQVGDTLQLQGQAGDGQRHYVKMIGYLKGLGVLVSAPTRDGKLLFMREGQAFVVRAFCGKHAYAFPTTITKVINSPFPYLHLAYPATVRGLAVRRFARVDVQIIASVSATGNAAAEPQSATIVNLSLGGAMLTAATRLGRRGDDVVVKFRLRLNDIESYLAVPGILRAIAPDENGSGLLKHGVEFGDIGQQDQLVLTAYVYQRLLEDTSDL